MNRNVILLSREPELAQAVRQVLAESRWKVRWTTDVATALAEIERESPDLVILDLDSVTPTGAAVTRTLWHRHPLLPILVLVGEEGADQAVGSFRAGATDYVLRNRLEQELVERVEQIASEDVALDAGLETLSERLSLETHLALAPDPAMATQARGNAVEAAPPMNLEELLMFRRQSAFLAHWHDLSNFGSHERRQHIRQLLSHLVSVFPLDEQRVACVNKEFTCFCRDLSPGGCSLLDRKPLVGDEFILAFPSVHKLPIHVFCRVVRRRRLIFNVEESGLAFERTATIPGKPGLEVGLHQILAFLSMGSNSSD